MKMFRPVILVTLLTILPTLAQAQMVCGKHEVIAQRLLDKYQETRRQIGVAGRNLIEVYASDSGSLRDRLF